MTFKTIIKAWAGYTAAANEEMTRILTTLPPSRLDEAIPSYFSTLGDLLDHTLRGSYFWLKRCADGGLLPDWLPAKLASLPFPPQGTRSFNDLAAFSERRRAVDAIYKHLADTCDEALLARTFTFAGRDKAEKTMEFGAALLAGMNHEVHHRGAVSTLLDGWKVDNDWSGLMPWLLSEK